MGEAAPAAAPVRVVIEAHGDELSVDVDGQQHSLRSALGGAWRDVVFESPGPVEREYQIDGSDTTSTNDRRANVVLSLLGTPLYAFDAWLRDEASYSRWEIGAVEPLSPARADGQPADFRVVAALRRPEALAHVWLLGNAGDREGLELDRDRRNARWVIQKNGAEDALPRWFFPEQPLPFAAELLHLLGRSAMAGFALLCGARLIGFVARLQRGRRGASSPAATSDEPSSPGGPSGASRALLAAACDALLPLWLLGAILTSLYVYHQLPHILDAVSYTFQAGLFARGALWIETPTLIQAFRGPFEVVSYGRWFSQYPPGAPAAYAIGQVVGLAWLVGPLACLVLIAATAWTAGALFGPFARATALLLGVLSPFVLFQSGSFLSHPIAGGLLACALAMYVRGERSAQQGWFGACGALLGAAFVTREVASVLFALPLLARLIVQRRWRPLIQVGAYGVPFVLVYLLYNDVLTGSAFVLPRTLFDASDHFGFGDGIGFHLRHTLAAGLANTDELLTLLQFDAFGWPPLFAFGLAGLPLLSQRARAWDFLALGGLLAFVVAYVGYFYHGVALGPRYYFEAMPWLILLCTRGVLVLGEVARSRIVALAVLGLLFVNTLAFYVPTELERRIDFSGLPDARPLSLAFVRQTVVGPRLADVPAPSLVVTADWWLYNAALAPLNCSRVPDCPVVFAFAPTDDDLLSLRVLYPGRQLLRAVESDGHLILQPLS